MKSILGDETQVKCISCGLQSGEIRLYGNVIAETEHFDVSQDYEIPIPGFFIYNGLGNLDRYNESTTPNLSYEKSIHT